MTPFCSYTSGKIDAQAQDTVEVVKEFAIDFLLRDNLRRQSGQIRISILLPDSSNGHISRAERYDTPIDTIFNIQDDNVGRVVGVLSLQIDINRGHV